MTDAPRKKSPRAPSLPLDEALDRVMRAYDKDRTHPSPVDVVAQHLGYKTANSGTALQAIASLRYYGLLERPSDGYLAVSKEVESYRFAPDESTRQALLRSFLRRPALFAELLDRFSDGLPSDANLRFDLIQRGFLPSTAASLVGVFRTSTEFAKYFEVATPSRAAELPRVEEVSFSEEPEPDPVRLPQTDPMRPRHVIEDESASDRIPVRLSGGRRAWLVIPQVFFEADKKRLKAQIDLLLTEDDEEPSI
ncbi:hypothetical protein D9M72_437970 [compost metagenome]